MKKLYLAYGSNLCKQQMAARCPDAEPVGPADLANFALVFRGVADIEPREGSTVYGGLWRISERDEAALDRYEGVKGGLYRKEWLNLNGEPVLVYRMNRAGYSVPCEVYYETIQEGFDDFDLPQDALIRAAEEVGAFAEWERQEWEDEWEYEGEEEVAA